MRTGMLLQAINRVCTYGTEEECEGILDTHFGVVLMAGDVVLVLGKSTSPNLWNALGPEGRRCRLSTSWVGSFWELML